MYFCAGFGFVVSATFTVAMVEKNSRLTRLGQLSVGIGRRNGNTGLFCLGSNCSQTRRYAHLANCVYRANFLSLLIPALTQNPSAAVFSAGLYGATFIGIVSLTLTIIGRYYPANPAKAMARLTLKLWGCTNHCPRINGLYCRCDRFIPRRLITGSRHYVARRWITMDDSANG